MTAPVRPEPGRIQRNIAALRAQGASEHDIEVYLTEHEHIMPSGEGQQQPHGQGLDASVPAHKAPKYYGGADAKAGAVHEGIDALTFGFGTKAMAGIDALGDATKAAVTGRSALQTLRDAYNQNIEARQGALHQYEQEHPFAAGGTALASAAVPLIASLGTSAPETGATLAAKAPLFAKVLKGLVAGAGVGAVNAVGHAHGGFSDYADRIKRDAAVGAAMGGVAPIVGKGAGIVADKLHLGEGISKFSQAIAGKIPEGRFRNALSRVSSSTGTKGAAGAELGQRAAMDEASGFVPKDAAPGVPLMALDRAGPNAEALAEGIATRPGEGRAALVRALEERKAQQATSLKAAAQKGTGVSSGGVDAVQKRLAVLRSVGAKFYKKAREATKGQPVVSPSLDEVLQTPSGQAAYGWAKMQKADMQSALPKVGDVAAAAAPAVETKTVERTLSIRDIDGRIRRNLTRVSDNELEGEYARLAETNATEEAHHAAIEESAYRNDYHELPETERLGRKGQEDLPDADGMVDPEQLAQDNKSQAGYRRSKVARQARDKAMQRLQAEMERRHGPADDFNFGANAEPKTAAPEPVAGPSGPTYQKLVEMGVPKDKALAAASAADAGKELPDPETIHLMKRYLRARTRPGTPLEGKEAAEAMGALHLLNKVQKELPPEWKAADKIYAEHARLVELSNRARSVFRTPINPAGQNARTVAQKSLGQLAVDVSDAGAKGQKVAQEAAAGSLNDLLESASSSRSPGQTFAKSPERIRQTRMAFPDERSAREFQDVVSAWDRIHQQAQRVIGNSRTGLRGVENSAVASSDRGAMAELMHGNVGSAVRKLFAGASASADRATRQRLDAELAKILTSADANALRKSVQTYRLRRIAGSLGERLLPRLAAAEATRE